MGLDEMGQNQKAILVAINRDQGGLIDPMGAENVKRTGVENLAWGFNTPTPSRPLAPCRAWQ